MGLGGHGGVLGGGMGVGRWDWDGGGVRPLSSHPAAGLGPEEGGHAGLRTFPGHCARPASHLGAVDPLFPHPPT